MPYGDYNWYERHSISVANFAASGGLSKETRRKLDIEDNVKKWDWLRKNGLDNWFAWGIIISLVAIAIGVVS